MGDIDVRFTTSLSAPQTAAWVQFLDSSRHSHPRQYPFFAAVELAQGRAPIYATGLVNGHIALVGLFAVRWWLDERWGGREALCIRGPVFDDMDVIRPAASQIRGYFRRQWVGSVRISPYWCGSEASELRAELEASGFGAAVGHSGLRRTGLVPIQLSDEALLSRLSASARAEVRRAIRHGVEVRPAGTYVEVQRFFEEVDRMNVSRGLPRVPDEEWRSMYSSVLDATDRGVLLIATAGDTYLGGLLILRSALTAHPSRFVVLASTLAKIHNQRLSPIIWWRGMQWARDRGCSYLDTEGFDPTSDKEHPLYAINKYKSEFNPEAVEALDQHTAACRVSLSAIGRSLELGERAFAFVRREWGRRRSVGPEGLGTRADG